MDEKFSFLIFICSQFNKRNKNMKIIYSFIKIINNDLSLGKIIFAYYGSQVLNNIDYFNKIIGNDFKKL